MRRWLILLFALSLTFELGTPRETAADPIVHISWLATTGAGTPGGATIEAAAGDMLTAGLFVDLMAGDVVVAYGISALFDMDGGNELDLLGVTELLPPGFFFNATVGVFGTTESELGMGGEVLTFEALTFVPIVTPTTFKIGEIEFLVTGNVATDGDDVVSGLFNPGVDAPPGGLPTTFHHAAVNSFPTVPEPTVGLLLASGVIALAAARSRRRR